MAAKVLAPTVAAAAAARGASMLSSRRLMNGAGFVGTAAALMVVQAQASPDGLSVSTAAFAAALFFTGLHAEGFRANYLDVTRAHAPPPTRLTHARLHPRPLRPRARAASAVCGCAGADGPVGPVGRAAGPTAGG